MKRAIVFIILLIPASTASAQTKGSITGRVVAEDGAVMSGGYVIGCRCSGRPAPLDDDG